MKYVKTKEGIFEVEQKYRDLVSCGEKGINYYQGWKIKKQADSIEELCDGWVLESKAYTSGFFVIYNTKENQERMKNFKLRKGETLFGAIWTDKGLIYVAKMNDKGELELL